VNVIEKVHRIFAIKLGYYECHALMNLPARGARAFLFCPAFSKLPVLKIAVLFAHFI
jgi:hypothetical protein